MVLIRNLEGLDAAFDGEGCYGVGGIVAVVEHGFYGDGSGGYVVFVEVVVDTRCKDVCSVNELDNPIL